MLEYHPVALVALAYLLFFLFLALVMGHGNTLIRRRLLDAAGAFAPLQITPECFRQYFLLVFPRHVGRGGCRFRRGIILRSLGHRNSL
jgi:hypothetical protein